MCLQMFDQLSLLRLLAAGIWSLKVKLTDIYVKRGTTYSGTISIPLPITRIPTYRSTALCQNNGEGEEISGDLSIELNWTDAAFLHAIYQFVDGLFSDRMLDLEVE